MHLKLNKRLFLLACLTLAATAAMVQAQSAAPVTPTQQAEVDTWKRYTVDGEKFSISLPSVPLMMTSEGRMEGSKNVRPERLLGVHSDGAVYAVFMYENPKRRQSLNDFIVEQSKLDPWHVASEQSVKVDGFRGKQYSLMHRVPETAQFFAVEDCLYQFRVVGTTSESAGAKKFFSSIAFKNVHGLVVNAPDVRANRGLENVLTASDVDVKARILTKPMPSFSEAARKKRISGTIILKVVFTSRGTVDNIQVVQAVPGLTEQAIETAMKIKFMPAMKDGKYVSTTLQLEYSVSYS